MTGALSFGPGPPRRRRRRLGRWLLASLVVAFLLVRIFVGELARVRGPSMAPNVLDGDVLWIDRRARPTPGAVVVIEPPDGPAVLRRILGVGGDRFETVEGLLQRNGEAMAARVAGAFAFRADAGDEGALRRQHLFEEALDGERSHRVVGDYLGAARPWAMDLPALDVPPGHVFVLCDNRRSCPLDEKSGAVPRAWIRGVARAVVWYGDAWIEPPADRATYGAETGLVSGAAGASSGGNVTGDPRK